MDISGKAKNLALVSLLVLVPVPSIGVLFGMILFPGTPIGKGVFFLSKIWILLLPALWFRFIEGGRFPRGKTEAGGFRMGLFTGLAICAFVVSMYLLLGRRLIDPAVMHDMAAGIGLGRKSDYIGAAFFWICVNSFLEEYVWRWFMARQFAKAMKLSAAVLASAMGFTLHHVLAMQVFFSWVLTLSCALCIFFAGSLWSWMFLHYKTIWPGWLSHALVDVAVFGIGYVLIFG